MCFFFQAEDGIRDLVRSRGLGDVYKRQEITDTLYITSFKYDSLGNLITQNYSFNSNKDDPDSIQYEYKEKGFVLSKKSFFLDRNRSNQNSTFITFYVYDKKNRLIEEQNSDGLSYRYEYK